MTMTINPIRKKFRQMIRANLVTIEKLAVASDLTFYQIKNMLHRVTLPTMTIKALKYSSLITEEEEKAYSRWMIDNGIPLERRGGPRASKIPRSSKKHQKQDSYDSGPDLKPTTGEGNAGSP